MKKQIITDIFGKAIKYLSAEALIRNSVIYNKNSILFKGTNCEFEADNKKIERILVVGAGKSSAYMAKSLEEILTGVSLEGIVSVKNGFSDNTAFIEVKEAGHPIPNDEGYCNARRILDLAKRANENDLIINLLSGGGSALLPFPEEGILPEEKMFVTDELLKRGADIYELNTVRKHLSAIKGGKLAKEAYPSTIVSLIISDVKEDRIDTIASGPTAFDETTFADARSILKKYNLENDISSGLKSHINKGMNGLVDETVKKGSVYLSRSHNIIIGNNEMLKQKIAESSEQFGYSSMVLDTFIEGEAKDAARVLLDRYEKIEKENPGRKLCVISGGETTVTVKGDGIGGRNQELALAAAIKMKERNSKYTLLSVGSDGNDGPTMAAGACVENETIILGNSMNLDANIFLANNDSYSYFKRVGGLYFCHPTKTNVMDIQIALIN